MNICLLNFGENISYHIQASFCIYSLLANGDGNIKTINVITDNPSFYNHLKHKVNVISITQKELTDWQGEHQFFWRIKIKAIEKICDLYPNSPVMYLDTDTFLFGDLGKLNNGLLANKAFMHKNEAMLSTSKSSTEKKMWKHIKDHLYGGMDMRATDCMWNAGVVATPNTLQTKDLRLAIAICDQMCTQGVTRRLIEQLALAIALDRLYELAEAKDVIAHYWTAKKIWDKNLGDFFIEAHFAQWPFETILEKVKMYDVTKTPIDVRMRSTNAKLKKVVDKFYPNEDIAFVKK